MFAPLIALLLTAPPAAEPPTFELRHHFTAGETITYVVKQSSAIDMRAENTEEQLKHSSETTRTSRIEKVLDDGSAVMLMTNVRARLLADAPDSDPVFYDSEAGGEIPEEFEGVAGKIGEPLMRMTVTPDGRVTKIASLQRVTTDVEAANRSNLQPFVPLPAESVAVGEKWKDVYQVAVLAEDGFPIPVKMQRTFKLTSVEDGIASVRWRAVVRTPLNDPRLQSQLVSRELAGKLTFDIEKGRVTSRTADGDKTIVGFAGVGTSMRTVTQRIENLIEGSETVAEVPGDTPR